jgi:hypothetical protein
VPYFESAGSMGVMGVFSESADSQELREKNRVKKMLRG